MSEVERPERGVLDSRLMKWKYWLIEVPAKLFELWWSAYRALLTLLIMVSVTTVFIALLLRLAGIRWGW